MKQTTTRFIVLLAAVTGLLTSSSAQVSTLYQFSQDTVQYAPITGGTLLADNRQDDNSYAANPIGFNFTYNNTVFTDFGVNVNGFIIFGASQFSMSYTPITTAALNNNLIAPLGCDLRMGFNFTANVTAASTTVTCLSSPIGIFVGQKIYGQGMAANTTITAISGSTVTISPAALATASSTTLTCGGDLRYETIGISPNRVCVIQWTSAQKFPGVGTDDVINFQTRLYETSNKIEFVYNVENVTSNTFAQVGIRGLSSADFFSRTSTSDWQTTTVAPSAGSTCILNASTRPISGLTFIWTPTLTSIPETIDLISFHVFPNPASDVCSLNWSTQLNVTSIDVFAVDGKLILNDQPTASTYNLNLSTLSPGIYFIRLTTAQGSKTERLVVQ